MSSRKFLIAAGALASALAAATSAQAVRMDGDGYVDDLQRNPRFIQPYGEEQPARYRAYDFKEGIDDRIQAEQSRRGGRRFYQSY